MARSLLDKLGWKPQTTSATWGGRTVLLDLRLSHSARLFRIVQS